MENQQDLVISDAIDLEAIAQAQAYWAAADAERLGQAYQVARAAAQTAYDKWIKSWGTAREEAAYKRFQAAQQARQNAVEAYARASKQLNARIDALGN